MWLLIIESCLDKLFVQLEDGFLNTVPDALCVFIGKITIGGVAWSLKN